MTALEAPTHRVFVSHASEDKPLVLKLATTLRLAGIDAWVDLWEIKRGDRLIDKIFEQGLRGADVFMVVLSKDSVNKPWVREELDAALVARIANKMRILPVRLDDCEVPIALRATRWSDLKEGPGFDEEVQAIIDDIYGRTTKPPLGQPPIYARVAEHFADDLTPLDNGLFKTLYDGLFNQEARDGQEGYRYYNGGLEDELAKELGATPDAVKDSVDVLHEQNLIRHTVVFGGGLGPLESTAFGWATYLNTIYAGFNDATANIAAALVRSGDGADANAVSRGLDIPYVVVTTVFALFEGQGLITVSRYSGGEMAYNISPRLKRKVLGG